MSWVAVGVGVSVAGGLVAADGQKQAGKSARKASELEARSHERNAQLAIEQAAEKERQFRVQFAQFQGQTKAATAASGLRMEGSALDVLEANARAGERDALTIRHEGELQRLSHIESAAIVRAGGKAQQAASEAGATASLLGGITQGVSFLAK